MRKYVWKYPLLLGLLLGAMLVNQAIVVGVSLFLRYVIDAIMGLDGERLVQAAFMAGGYLLALVGSLLLSGHLKAQFMYRVMRDVRTDVFSGVMGKTIPEFGIQNSGQYLSILNNDMGILETNYLEALLTKWRFGMSLGIAVLMLLWLNPVMALITVMLSLLPLSVSKIYGKRIGEAQGQFVASMGRLNEKAKDFLEGFEVIKTNLMERSAREGFGAAAAVLEGDKRRFNLVQAHANALGNLFGVGVQFVLFLVAGYFVLEGLLTVGSIIAVTQLSGNIVAPIQYLLQQNLLLKGSVPVVEKLEELLGREHSEVGDEVVSFQKGIEVRNLSFKYGSQVALNGVSATFAKGGKYAIVGGSGSGKSTFAKLLMGYFDNYEGQISVDGRELRRVCKASWYRMLSAVHQRVFLFDDTLRANLTLNGAYGEADFERASKMANLCEVVEKLPEKLESPLGEGGANLSGGERQRVAIARALIRNPELLIMDEATASLDNETAYEVERQLLEDLETTAIVVTHRMHENLLRKYDGILVMKDGEIVESGDFETLYEGRGHLFELLSV